MTKKIALILFVFYIAILIFGLPLTIKAVENNTPINQTPNETSPSESSCEAGDNEICLNVPIGDTEKMSLTNALSDYIALWYSFIIGAIGIFATVMIMYGGIKWLTSRGNSAAIGDAKEKIFSALIGLVLAFLSYTILYLINPNLTIIKTPSLPSTADISYDAEGKNNTDKWTNPLETFPESSSMYRDFENFLKNCQYFSNNPDGLPIECSGFQIKNVQNLGDGEYIYQLNGNQQIYETLYSMARLDGTIINSDVNNGPIEFEIEGLNFQLIGSVVNQRYWEVRAK